MLIDCVVEETLEHSGSALFRKLQHKIGKRQN